MCSEHDTAIEAAAWELPPLKTLFFLVFKYFVSDDDFLDTSAKSCGYFLFSLDIFYLQREVCVETVQSGEISLGISCR